MGRLRLRVIDGSLTGDGSVDAVFGGEMRLGALNLWIQEGSLRRLIKTTDFLRMSAVQRLTELKLLLVSFSYFCITVVFEGSTEIYF